MTVLDRLFPLLTAVAVLAVQTNVLGKPASTSAAATHEAIVYSSAFAGYSNTATQRVFGLGGVTFDVDDTEVVSGHRAYKYSDCRTTQLKFCLDSEIFSFGVPTDLVEGRRWSVRDINFNVTRAKKISWQGELVDAYDIKSVYPKLGYQCWFVYTKSFGLIAMSCLPKTEFGRDDIVRGVLYLSAGRGLGVDR